MNTIIYPKLISKLPPPPSDLLSEPRQRKDAPVVVKREDVALLTTLHDEDSNYQEIKNVTSYPLTVELKPCSYLSAIDLKMRMGINAHADDPLKYEHVSYSERLNLAEI